MQLAEKLDWKGLTLVSRIVLKAQNWTFTTFSA